MAGRNTRGEVEQYGIDYDQFCKVVWEVFKLLVPDWTDEELACHQWETDVYINAVRMRMRCRELPDYLVMRTLFNLRKDSRKGIQESEM